MRKYLWLGTALTVTAALSVYWAAQFAAKHPESFVSNCLSAARLGLYLSSPALPQVALQQGTGETAGCNAVVCAHRPDHQPKERLPRMPRVPKPTAPVKCEDPEEVIHIEQVDPKVAQMIAEMLEIPAIINRVQVAGAADKGPDEVVLTILDGIDPSQLLDPQVKGSRPQVCPASASPACRPPLHMPYCADSEEELASLERNARTKATRHTGPRDPGARFPAMPVVDEPTDWVMPCVDDDAEDQAIDASNPNSMPKTSDEDTNTSPPSRPMQPYHHEPEGCPYFNGGYCPRYSHTYAPPPPTTEARQPESQSAPTEGPQVETEEQQPSQPVPQP